MNQHTKLINLLDDGAWHCSNELRDLYIPEYRSRINELRKKGYNILDRRCLRHPHDGSMNEWRLVSFNQAKLETNLLAEQKVRLWDEQFERKTTQQTLY